MKSKVLIADDDSAFRQMIRVSLEAENFEVVEAEDGQQCIEKTLKENPQVILMDIVMPNMDGLKACNILRNMVSTKYTPIIFLTIRSEVEDKLEGFECGADDYLPKPFDPSELCARIKAILIRTMTIKNKIETLETLYQRVSSANEELRKQVIIDELTKLYNYGYFIKRMEEEVNRCIRYNRHFTIILFDLDDFARINANYSHQFGDRVLREIGFILMNLLRGIDIVARYGGEEFIALLPETDLEGARSVAKRIQNKISRLEVADGNVRLLEKITVSGAICFFPEHGASVDEILKKADRGINQAKRSGKNTIVVSEI